jgi:hypothetical protein
VILRQISNVLAQTWCFARKATDPFSLQGPLGVALYLAIIVPVGLLCGAGSIICMMFTSVRATWAECGQECRAKKEQAA